MASIKVIDTTPYSAEVKDALRKHKQVSRKQLLWLDLYFGAAQMNATEAARLARYKFPSVEGPALKRRFEEAIGLIFNEMSTLRRAEANEVIEMVSNIARNGTSESNRLKALEMLAKIHGLFSERLSISVDRRTLMKQIEGILQAKKEVLQPKLLSTPIDIQATPEDDNCPE